MDERRPVFIIGSPRSGTSLLRLILTSHSQIIIPPECGFIVWLWQKYHDWTASNAHDDRLIEQFLADLYVCKKFDTWALDKQELNSLIRNRQPTDYATLCALIYEAYANSRSRSAVLWGDKNNFHVNHLPTLNEIYPEARFLHIVRDGRDVVCSYREVMKQNSTSPYAPQFRTDIESIAGEWSSNVCNVENYLSGLDGSRKRTLRYEDLVRQPESAIAGICAWVGLDYEQQMLEFHDRNIRDQLEPTLTMDWKQRTIEPVSAKTVGRFRTLLTADELERFNRVAGNALCRFGYMERGL